MRWLIILLFCSGTAAAQSDLGNWMMYFGTNKIDNHWSIHTEAQHRNYTVQPQLEQLLLRTGVNYKFDNGLMLTGGYANITNYEFQSSRIGPEVEEHRIWQQLITASYFGKPSLSIVSDTSNAGLKATSKRGTATAACCFIRSIANPSRSALIIWASMMRFSCNPEQPLLTAIASMEEWAISTRRTFNFNWATYCKLLDPLQNNTFSSG